jgi:hypothetical protein
MDPDLDRRLRQLGTRHRRLRADLETVRLELHDLVIEAARAGVPQSELVEITGYTRDRIRVICREAGLDPLPQGRKPARRG